MNRSRGPSYGGSDVRVTAPTDAERITPSERVAREGARTAGEAFDQTAQPRTRNRSRGKAWGVRPDHEVSTDAVAAVEQAGDGWEYRWVLAEQQGGLVARSLHIEASGRATPPGGVTSNLLRALSPSRVAAVGADEAQRLMGGRGTFVGLTLRWARRDVAETGPEPTQRRKPGRPKLSDDLLRSVAIAYLEELKAGRGVLRRLGERFDRPQPTMRDWVRIARREGFLSHATQPGSRGALPGPRLPDESDPSGEGQS